MPVHRVARCYQSELRPYLELVGGLKPIDSAYSLSFPSGNGVTSVFADATTPAWTIGLGLGVDWLLVRQNGDRDSGLLITLGLRKQWGSRVSLED